MTWHEGANRPLRVQCAAPLLLPDAGVRSCHLERLAVSRTLDPGAAPTV